MNCVCGKKIFCKGLCRNCYQRNWKKENKVKWEKIHKKAMEKYGESGGKSKTQTKYKKSSKGLRKAKEGREKNTKEYEARNETNQLFIKLGMSREGYCLRCGKHCKRLQNHHISYKPNIAVFGFCAKCHKKIERS